MAAAIALLMIVVIAGAANNGMEKKCVGLIRAICRFLRLLLKIIKKRKLMTATTHKSLPPWAQGIGYSGLIPFVALALAIWLLEPINRLRSVTALLAYGASILSFLGAIHWGLLMCNTTSPQSKKSLVWGVIPSLLAWIALLLDPIAGLYLVAVGLWSCFAVDRVVYSRVGVQMWLPMRLILTMVASLSCIAGAIGAMQ